MSRISIRYPNIDVEGMQFAILDKPESDYIMVRSYNHGDFSRIDIRVKLPGIKLNIKGDHHGLTVGYRARHRGKPKSNIPPEFISLIKMWASSVHDKSLTGFGGLGPKQFFNKMMEK